MTPATLDALQASIAKWERNAVAETPDEYSLGWNNCALCNLFWEDACFGCPVAEKTGSDCCNGTPYQRANNAKTEWVRFLKTPQADDFRDKARAAAVREVDFLKSLLPSEGQADA